MYHSSLDKLLKREKVYIDLIPSHSFLPVEIYKYITTHSKTIHNIYFEGYPGNRYYPGCEDIDNIENLYSENVKYVFKCKFCNVQPLSGTMANIIIYKALFKPGQKILSLQLTHGGHLSHTNKNKLHGFDTIHYNYNPETNNIDYEQIENIILSDGNIAGIITGYSLGTYNIDFEKIHNIAKKHKIYHIADVSHVSGLIAANLFNNPVDFADVVMTTTHKSLRGIKGAIIMTNSEQIIKDINKQTFPSCQSGGNHLTIIVNYMVSEYWKTEGFKQSMVRTINNTKVISSVLSIHFKLVGNSSNHMIVLDLSEFNIDTKIISNNLEYCGILANYNAIYKDKDFKKSSGLRIGTQNLAFYGYSESALFALAALITEIIKSSISGKFEYEKEKYKLVAKAIIDENQTF